MPPTNATSGVPAGRAFVELFADDSRLVRGLRRAQRKLRAFGTAVRGIALKMAGLGAAITPPLAAASKVFASAGDDLDKMAKRTGVSVEALSELGFAAEQSEADLNALANAVLRMNRRIGRIRAGQGTTTQVEAMEALGLSAEALSKLSPEQTLNAIADAMAAMEDPTQAAGLAQRAFGTEVDKVLPPLLQGADGMDKLRGQARKLGLTIGDITGIVKSGWAYLWLRYQEVEDTTAKMLIQKPIAAYVEQVYREGDFSLLGIGV